MFALPFVALSVAVLSLSSDTGFEPTSPHDVEVPPDVSSYAGIDAALEGRVVLAPDATWRYFPGTENPSPELEWTKEDFDDASWLEGAAPFGFGASCGDLGTTLEAAVPALYLRREISFPDRSLFGRILLELPIDDGYIVWVNGREEDRLSADKADTYHAFDATTRTERAIDTPPVPTIALKRVLRDGVNTLAIQVLTQTEDRDSLGARPRVRVVFDVTEAGEQARLLELSALLTGEEVGIQARRSYLEGRHLQRLGRHADAIAPFERAAALDPAAQAIWKRRVEVHRVAGSLAALDGTLHAQLASGDHTPAMLDAWAQFALEDLGQSPVEFAARVASVGIGAGPLPLDGLFAEALWSGRALAAGRSLRIDCGAIATIQDVPDGDDTAWDKDRCFGEGTAPRSLEGATPRASVRVCSRALDVLVPAYRVPLPAGAYEVVLHFTPSDGDARSAGDAVFDLSLEDARVARGIDPVASGAPGSLRFPLFVRDGFLEVELYPLTGVDPWLAGLEVHPLDADNPRFSSAVVDWVNATAREQAFPLAQEAELFLAGGDLRAACATLEEAELLPDFGPAGRKRLAEVRDRLLPEVLSFATVDDLLARRPADANVILHAVRAAGLSDPFVSYFEGRLEQLAGRPDEALVGFEALAFGEGEDPEPVQRMAECLADIGLAEDALAIVSEALERGVRLSPELLQVWISLQLGPLGVDPWDVIDGLSVLDVPEELVVVPTSGLAARTWRITNIEPPATAWSRPEFDDSAWRVGRGMIGSGNTPFGRPRSHSDKEMVFARQGFTLSSDALLFPYFVVCADGASECYLNGRRAARVSIATGGYVHMPVRPAPFLVGRNTLGQVGFNSRDESVVDTGIMQPLAELIWIKRQLDETGALRINCGGDDLRTADGKNWSRDRFFGWALAAEPADEGLDIAGTEHDALFRTNRWFFDDATGALHQVPLPNGPYHVTLYFAEIDEAYRDVEPDAAGGSSRKVRTFDVRLETELILDDLDVVAEVGFATALEREFDIEIQDGWFDLQINDPENRSFLSAFEIEVGSGN